MTQPWHIALAAAFAVLVACILAVSWAHSFDGLDRRVDRLEHQPPGLIEQAPVEITAGLRYECEATGSLRGTLLVTSCKPMP